MLVRVVAKHFVAGLVMDGDICARAAPILKWAVGKRRAWLSRYFVSKGWEARVVRADVSSPPHRLC